MSPKTERDYGLDNWCPFYRGETVYSRHLVGDWIISEIGLGSVRIANRDSVLIEISPQELKPYPDETYLKP